jgi:hypothetical protein
MEFARGEQVQSISKSSLLFASKHVKKIPATFPRERQFCKQGRAQLWSAGLQSRFGAGDSSPASPDKDNAPDGQTAMNRLRESGDESPHSITGCTQFVGGARVLFWQVRMRLEFSDFFICAAGVFSG